MIKIRTIISVSVLFALCFFSFFADATARVSLRATDVDGNELEQAQVGRPFVLEVSVEGASGNVTDPTIENLPLFGKRRTGYHMNMINNSAAIKYNYLTRVDKDGLCSIGPAFVEDDGNLVESGIVTLHVGREEKSQQIKRPKAEESKTMFLQLSTPKKRAVVGEKIEGTITFYTRIPDVALRSLAQPSLEGFTTTTDLSAPKQGVREIDGQRYNYATWHWHFFAKKPGDLLIPSCSIDIVVRDEDDTFYPSLSSFFGFRSTRKRLSSDLLTLQIDPLPAQKEKVDAVGRFANFTAAVNQAVVREGDGIVLTLALEGDGDLENLEIELQDIPHVFKSYSSKQHSADKKNKNGMRKKSFEFIVQGLEPGEWEIPEQRFRFYDVASQSYKTLSTSPLMLKILHQAATKKFVPPPPDAFSTALDTTGKTEDGLLALNTYGRWREAPERKMPGWLFMILVFVPLGLWFSGALRQVLHRYRLWRVPRTRWKNAFKIARKKLERAKERHDATALYRLFVDLFAIRCSVAHAQVSDEMIKKVLRSGGFSDEQLSEWEKFFSGVSAFVFYSAQGADEEKKLFDQADRWIGQLEDVL